MSLQATDVSIVTSLYGSARHLAGFLEQVEACLRLVESRGYSAETIIVSNSPDRREQRTLRATFNSPWWCEHGRLIVVKRETLYASWNRGVRAARGATITFWNVDDYRNPDAIVEGIELVRSGTALIRFPWLNIVERRTSHRESRRLVETKDPRHDLDLDPRVDFCVGPFFMFARPLFDEYGPFDEQFHIVGDFDWQLRVVPHVGLEWATRLGGIFFVDGFNLSSTGNQRLLVEQNVLYRRFALDRPQWPLEPDAEELARSYRIDQPPTDRVTYDWSYDRQWRRRKSLSRVYHACRRFVGKPIRALQRRQGAAS